LLQKFDSFYLPLLVTSKFKVFAAFDGQLFPVLARRAFQTQSNLFCGLGLRENKL